MGRRFGLGLTFAVSAVTVAGVIAYAALSERTGKDRSAECISCHSEETPALVHQ